MNEIIQICPACGAIYQGLFCWNCLIKEKENANKVELKSNYARRNP